MITVIDSPCGAGKSFYCMKMVRENPTERYVYVTPYLDEINRIVKNNNSFYRPTNENKQGKLCGLKTLLDYNVNIATTHALFRKFDEETVELVKDGAYNLILDEVADVVNTIEMEPKDIEYIKSICDVKEDGQLIWKDDNYSGSYRNFVANYKELKKDGKVKPIVLDIMELCKEKRAYISMNKFIVWTFPVEVFNCFKSVTICTYMFDAQIQRYYYDLYNVKYTKKSIVNHELVEYTPAKSNINKLHIEMDESLNEWGRKTASISTAKYNPLSHNWFNTRKSLKFVINSMFNFYYNKHNAKTSDVIWTTFKDVAEQIGKAKRGLNFKDTKYKNFLSCNARATNDYDNRHYVIYGINKFISPEVKNFFTTHNIEIDEDSYALSEMIQFIYRSAIRKNEDTYVYIPSERMRSLLIEYMNPLYKM